MLRILAAFVAVGAFAFALPASVSAQGQFEEEGHEGHGHGMGEHGHGGHDQEKEEVARTVAARVARSANQLSENLAARHVDPSTIAEVRHSFEETFEAALENPVALERVYQERLLYLRDRLMAEGVQGDALKARLEDLRKYYSDWKERRIRPVRLPEARK